MQDRANHDAHEHIVYCNASWLVCARIASKSAFLVWISGFFWLWELEEWNGSMACIHNWGRNNDYFICCE